MLVSELFDIKYGINLELDALEQSDDADAINFVARTAENNGVVARVKRIPGKEPQPAGILTCAGGGSVLSTFVQDKPFYSGRDLYLLIPKKEMSLEEKLFYCHAIKMNAYRYSYGRQANRTLKNINLPPLPDWLKKYKIDYNPINTKIKHKELPFDTKLWKSFKLSDLFEISGTKTTKLDELETYGSGEYPYVTTQATNNGVAGFYNYFTEKGNVLVIDSAVAGFCSYQAFNFSASDHVEKLTPKFELNSYIGAYLATVINKERYRYSYGRKFNQTKIRNTVIKLPVDKNGNPDWDYMEKYIKSLPYSDLI